MKNVDLKNETPTCGNTLLCPVLGQTYNYFDDGKIRPSRRMEVVITEIIPFNEIDAETLESWKEEVEECNWLYAKETDFFAKGDLKVSDDKIEKIIFVRTINNNDGWFSLGWWGGRLDIDGSLNALLNGHKAVANFPANNTKSGISTLVANHRAEKIERKVDIIAAGNTLANMQKC